MSITRVHHNIDLSRLAFTADCGDGLDLLDTLADLVSSAEKAYEEALKLFSTSDDDIPRLRWTGREWLNADTKRPIPVPA